MLDMESDGEQWELLKLASMLLETTLLRYNSLFFPSYHIFSEFNSESPLLDNS